MKNVETHADYVRGNKHVTTHAERVRETQDGISQDQADHYHDILRLAENAQRRGDHVTANQRQHEAEEYADTRMSIHAKRIAGIAD